MVIVNLSKALCQKRVMRQACIFFCLTGKWKVFPTFSENVFFLYFHYWWSNLFLFWETAILFPYQLNCIYFSFSFTFCLSQCQGSITLNLIFLIHSFCCKASRNVAGQLNCSIDWTFLTPLKSLNLISLCEVLLARINRLLFLGSGSTRLQASKRGIFFLSKKLKVEKAERIIIQKR